MNDVAKYPGLLQRGSRWYVRVAVPKDLVESLGKKQIWRSLETGSNAKARRLYPKVRAEIEAEFERVRAGKRELTEEEARTWALEYFRENLRSRTTGIESLLGPELADAIETAQRDLNLISVGFDEEVGGWYHGTASNVLISKGWPPKPQAGPIKPMDFENVDIDAVGKEYWTFVQYLRRADLEVQNQVLAILERKPIGQVFDTLFSEAEATDGSQNRRKVAKSKPGPTLSEILESWEADQDDRPLRTVEEWRSTVRQFHDACGVFPVSQITKADIRKFIDTLRKPNPASTKKQTGKLSAQTICSPSATMRQISGIF